MKRKWIALTAAVLFVGAALSSCHSTTPCPAYAKNDENNKPHQENTHSHQKNLALHHQEK
jgi:hypothetical protein